MILVHVYNNPVSHRRTVYCKQLNWKFDNQHYLCLIENKRTGFKASGRSLPDAPLPGCTCMRLEEQYRGFALVISFSPGRTAERVTVARETKSSIELQAWHILAHILHEILLKNINTLKNYGVFCRDAIEEQFWVPAITSQRIAPQITIFS